MNNDTYVIATVKPWNIALFKRHFGKRKNIVLIDSKERLTYARLKKINPKYVFFPHWSWIIPCEIWKNFACIVFHMTDLPYGRGGTPLQNLIVRGHTKTKLSALRVDGGLDTGPILLKCPLPLHGSAEDIYTRASQTVFETMIPFIIKNNLQPKQQTGKATVFKRRSPLESKISESLSITKLYDFIRMLDAPSYPRAYLETDTLRFEFLNAQKIKKTIRANVTIYEK